MTGGPMTSDKPKPQGVSGPIKIGPDGVVWEVIHFPEAKDERERLVAELFIGAFDHWVASESEPSLKPFSGLKQNGENDLDFTVTTSQGVMLMELAEFAPLKVHGPTFLKAPKSLHPSDKAPLAHSLIMGKSEHQGGAGRFLIVYATEHAFWLDPPTIEILRRRFAAASPNFERVYWVSLHNLKDASASEIYPGVPHHIFGDMPDEELLGGNFMIPHPTEMTVVNSFHGLSSSFGGGSDAGANVTVSFSGMNNLKKP